VITISEQELAITLSIIREHVPDCDVFVFGSRSNGTARSYSDLDLAFKHKNRDKLSIRRIGILRDTFQESALPFRVDVVDYYSTSIEFRKLIDEESISIL